MKGNFVASLWNLMNFHWKAQKKNAKNCPLWWPWGGEEHLYVKHKKLPRFFSPIPLWREVWMWGEKGNRLWFSLALLKTHGSWGREQLGGGEILTPGGEAGLYTGLITITKKRIGELRWPHPWVPWNSTCQNLKLIRIRHPCHQANRF